MDLRDYQRAAVDAVWAYWRRGGGNPLIEIPTGGGKSAVLGTLAREVVERGSRVLIATHRKELIEQDAAACRSVWPGGDVGIYSASLGIRQIRAITVAGVQSIYRRAEDFGSIGVLIIDEAHLVSPTAQTSYQRLISGLRDVNPELRILGLTATPYRLGQGLLTTGKDHLFDSIVYRAHMRDLIAQGFLSPLISCSSGVQIDTSTVATSAGEFAARDLELASDVDSINDAVAGEVGELIRGGRTSALVFGVSVAHATRLCWALRGHGVVASLVTGETSAHERKQILADFRARKIQAITSCDVLTTGFDAPVVDVVALVRPTKSTSLYVQMVGRGSRICAGKSDCVVLDFGGNIARHGPVDDVRPPKPKGEGEGTAPTRVCPECSAEVPASSRECSECGFVFPEVVRKANAKASKLAVMTTTTKKASSRSSVGRVAWRKHSKKSDPSAPPTLRMDYYSLGDGDDVALKIASEWVCLDHSEGSFPRRRAEEWWCANVGEKIPVSVDDAIAWLDAGRMARVTAIVTEPDGEYTRVVRVLQERPREPGDDDGEEESTTESKGYAEDELPF